MNIKKIGICLPVLLFICLLLFTACSSGGNGGNSGSGEAEEVYEIAYQGLHARPQFLTQYAHIPLADNLNEKSSDRLDVAFFDQGAIAKNDEVMNAIGSGLMEMGIGSHGYEPGRYPLTDLGDLPLIFPSGSIAGLATWKLYENNAEWRAQYPDDVIILSHFCGALTQLHMVTKPIRTLEELQGVRIIAISSTGADIIEALGAIPITIGTADWYISLERGMAEGILCPFAPIRAYQITDIAKYHTVIDISTGSFYLAMNKDFYESLPDDLRELVDAETGEYFSTQCGYGLDFGAEEDLRWMMEQGDHEFIIPSEEEMAKWAAAVEPVIEKKLQELEGKGYANARSIYAEMLGYIAELEEAGAYIPDYLSIVQ